MITTRNYPVIAIEEHYWDRELEAQFSRGESTLVVGEVYDRLHDFGQKRLADMDAAGVDFTVLSHGAPSGQCLEPELGVPLIQRVNDRLHATIEANPTRFGAFAALPTAAPEAAADELERCVALGFQGAMIHGMTNGEFIDRKKFWPIFARAEQLDVPIYLHPGLAHPAVLDIYYGDYLNDFPYFARPAWGFAVDCGTQAIRLMLSGIFEKHPKLKIILGHLGESIPFQIWRIDSALNRKVGKSIAIRDIFTNNYWVTTSGFFSTPALLCCLLELGVERIIFSVDWPFVADSKPGVDWLTDAPLSSTDKEKIFSGNVKRLLKLAC